MRLYLLGWRPDFSEIIMEMCKDALVMGSDEIGWPGWMVDRTLYFYWHGCFKPYLPGPIKKTS